ncbi:MAG: hypothetical protein HC871_06945 [Rhizobiales bacterium]|nr:hypothetical protein [Hyphomicrobiales bacterium]
MLPIQLTYMALWLHDRHALQNRLMPFGLSSLGGCESRVLESLDSVIASLERICRVEPASAFTSSEAFFQGIGRRAEACTEVFGPVRKERQTRIMVTLPAEAAHDQWLVEALVERGMDAVRINCARSWPLDTAQCCL